MIQTTLTRRRLMPLFVFLTLSLIFSALFTAACRPRLDTSTNDSGGLLASGGPNGLLPPPAGTNGNKINKAVVLKAWNDEAKMFYGKPPTGYESGTPEAPVSIDADLAPGCLTSCPSNYSTLVCHYYCWHPSYKKVTPNIRGCFTNIIQKRIVVPNAVGLDNFPNIFDYCMYQDFNISTKPIPPYDASIIAANKAKDRSGGRIGVLKYMSPEQEEVFKYLMFTWWNPNTFDFDDQQATLDSFYATQKAAGVTMLSPPTVKRTGGQVLTQWEPFMKTWDKANGGGTPTTPPTNPPTTPPTSPPTPSPGTPGQSVPVAGTYLSVTSGITCKIAVSNVNSVGPLSFSVNFGPTCDLKTYVLRNVSGTASNCTAAGCTFQTTAVAPKILVQIGTFNKLSLSVNQTPVKILWVLSHGTPIPPGTPGQTENVPDPGFYVDSANSSCGLQISGVNQTAASYGYQLNFSLVIDAACRMTPAPMNTRGVNCDFNTKICRAITPFGQTVDLSIKSPKTIIATTPAVSAGRTFVWARK